MFWDMNSILYLLCKKFNAGGWSNEIINVNQIWCFVQQYSWSIFCWIFSVDGWVDCFKGPLDFLNLYSVEKQTSYVSLIIPANVVFLYGLFALWDSMYLMLYVLYALSSETPTISFHHGKLHPPHRLIFFDF